MISTSNKQIYVIGLQDFKETGFGYGIIQPL